MVTQRTSLYNQGQQKSISECTTMEDCGMDELPQQKTISGSARVSQEEKSALATGSLEKKLDG